MSEVKEKDNFWLYVGAAMVSLITVIILVKINESEKYDQIQQLEDEEIRMLNIRVLN